MKEFDVALLQQILNASHVNSGKVSCKVCFLRNYYNIFKKKIYLTGFPRYLQKKFLFYYFKISYQFIFNSRFYSAMTQLKKQQKLQSYSEHCQTSMMERFEQFFREALHFRCFTGFSEYVSALDLLINFHRKLIFLLQLKNIYDMKYKDLERVVEQPVRNTNFAKKETSLCNFEKLNFMK